MSIVTRQSKDSSVKSDHSIQARPLTVTLNRPTKTVSFILIGLVLFICADLMARFTFACWPIDHFNSPNRSWIWWTTKSFRAEKQKPQIVLLGSSLMVAAVNGGDARLSGERQNNVLHHRSLLLERLLKNLDGQERRNFSFAICGQMTSDAFFIVSTLLKGADAPPCIIYGIAPRDLMDNTMTSTATTETFKYLERTKNLDSVRVKKTFWEQVDSCLGRICFTYSHRADLAYLQQRIVYEFSKLLFPGSDLEMIKCPPELRKIAMIELPEDNAPNESFTLPAEQIQTDNTAEYKSRYHHFDKRQFDEQTAYLSDLIKTCQTRRIRLILVNMPVTQTNLALMPPQFYSSYWQSLQGLSGQSGVRLVNLNEPKLFAAGDFLDSVHLNSAGAAKFMDLLAAKLVSDPTQKTPPTSNSHSH